MRGRDDASQPAEAGHQVQCTAGVVRPGRCCDEALDDTMTSGHFAYVCRSGVVCVLCLTDIGECESETCQNEGMRTSPTPTPTQLTKTESPSVSSQTPLPALARPAEGDSCEHDVDGRGALRPVHGRRLHICAAAMQAEVEPIAISSLAHATPRCSLAHI